MSILQILLYFSVVQSSTQRPHNILSDLIDTTFKNSFCLYYLTVNPSTTPIIKQINLNGKQIILSDFENIETLNANKQFQCNGYIIDSNNGSDLKDLFSIQTIHRKFKPNRKVIIILDQLHQFNYSAVETATLSQDLDLIIIGKNCRISNDKPEKLLLVMAKKLQFNNSCLETIKLVAYNKIFTTDELIHNQKYLEKKSFMPSKYLRRTGKSFLVSMFDCPPFATVNDKATKTYNGPEMEFLKDVVGSNSPIAYIVNEQQDAESHENLYDNILEQVIDLKSDIGICSQWQPKVYGMDLQLTQQYAQTCITFLVPKPMLLPSYTFIFQPFRISLWLVYLIIFVCTSVCFIRILLTYHPRNDNSLAILYLFRLFLLGPLNMYPKSSQISLRLLILSSSITCMLVSTYYSAGLTTSLSFPPFSADINTFEDMIAQSIKWQATDDSIKHWMANTENRNLQALSKQFVVENDPLEFNEQVRKHKMATFVEIINEDYVRHVEVLDHYGRTHMKVLPEKIACFYAVFILKTNSPYVDVFNRAINNFLDYGLMHHLFKKFVNQPQHRFRKEFFQHYEEEVHQQINFSKIQGAFYLLIGGHLAALIIFCFEYLPTLYRTG